MPLITLALLGSVYIDSTIIKWMCMSASIVMGLNLIYAFLQTQSIDPLFENKLKKGGAITNPIGTIGNPNYLVAFLCGTFWLSVYSALFLTPFFFVLTAFAAYMIYKIKVRAGQVAMAGSILFFLLVMIFYDLVPIWFSINSISFNLGLAVIILGCLFIPVFLKLNWNTFFYKPIDPKGKQIWYATLRYRFCYWLAALNIIKKRFFLGNGLWSYRKKVYEAQAELNDKDDRFLNPNRYITPQPRNVHNDYLEHLVEFGIVGFFIFITFIISLYYYGFVYLNSTLGTTDFFVMLLLLTNLTCLLVNAFFFFTLRIPSSAIMFWLTSGMIISLSCQNNLAFKTNYVVVIFAALLSIGILWECIGKRVIASYHVLRYRILKNPQGRIYHLMCAIKVAPFDSALRTYAVIETLDNNPMLANLHAYKLLEHYDGQNPYAMSLFNIGIARARTTNIFDEAEFFLKNSHRLLPSFKPTLDLLNSSNGVGVRAKYKGRRAIMRKANQETIFKFKFLNSEKEKIGLAQQIARQEMEKINERLGRLQAELNAAEAILQNALLAEKKRLNIPDNWIFDADSGEFKDPQTLTQKG